MSQRARKRRRSSPRLAVSWSGGPSASARQELGPGVPGAADEQKVGPLASGQPAERLEDPGLALGGAVADEVGARDAVEAGVAVAGQVLEARRHVRDRGARGEVRPDPRRHGDLAPPGRPGHLAVDGGEPRGGEEAEHEEERGPGPEEPPLELLVPRAARRVRTERPAATKASRPGKAHISSG